MKALMILPGGEVCEYEEIYAKAFGLVFLYFPYIHGEPTLVAADATWIDTCTHEKLLAFVRDHFKDPKLQPTGAGRCGGPLKSWRSLGLNVATPTPLIQPIAKALGITP